MSQADRHNITRHFKTNFLYYKFNNVLLPINVACIFRYDTENGNYDLRNSCTITNCYICWRRSWVKKKEKWFIKMAEWLSKPRAPRTPHSSLHIRINNVNIMSLVFLYISFFLCFFFSIALIETSPFCVVCVFIFKKKFLFLNALCPILATHVAGTETVMSGQ